MAKVCAVIAEYNPFHNGHAYHLQKAREITHADTMLVLMSGCFTQRGEIALISPYARAEMALQCGADLVLTAPVLTTVREADSYAQFNIEILNQMPFVTHLAFGAECGSLEELSKIASILENNDPHLDETIKKNLEAGNCSHAGALSAALYSCYGIPKYMTNEPNNILAICYLRALQKTKSKIQPVLIQRKNSYHSQIVDADFPSATSIRQAVLRSDWAAAQKGMPPKAYEVLKSCALANQISRPDHLDAMLRYRLATLTRSEFWSLPDVYEGIENLLFKTPHASMTREQLLQRLTTRRYSMARVSRLLCHTLLHTKAEVWNQNPVHAHVVGLREASAPVIKYLRKTSLTLVSKRHAYEINEALLMDRKADEIWNISTGGNSGMIENKTIVVK